MSVNVLVHVLIQHFFLLKIKLELRINNHKGCFFSCLKDKRGSNARVRFC